ncbi:MAG: hypothetical protein CMB29_00745 [Euryarchaeota archaeon]|nr:hypothetical protein [Euryarchaeota archaeon]
MAIHHINCRVTASGVDNLSVLTDAMSWLCGSADLLVIEKSTSYHGSEINLITLKIGKNQDIRAFFGKLIQGNYPDIRQSITKRIDSSNTLHFRLCVDALIAKQIKFIDTKLKTIKCNVKIKVFPGQDIIQNLDTFIASC